MEDLQFENRGIGRHFTIICNTAIRDKRLSWRAKGILAGCLSHNSSFKFNRAWIIEHGAEGRDAVISALAELRELGYLKNEKIRDDDGHIVGERYVVTDRPPRDSEEGGAPAADAASAPVARAGNEADTGVLESRTPENQRPGKPDAGKPGRLRRPVERRPIEENQSRETPLSPLPKAGACPVELPDWLEPHREQLTAWLDNRRRRHRLPPALTALTVRALEYAMELGVLAEYCEHASERNWQSLGFAGYRDYVYTLAKEKRGGADRFSNAKPTMAPIVYTLN